MIVGIYNPPDSTIKPWPELRVGTLVNATGFEYDKQFCGVGTFEFTVPKGSRDADKLKRGQLLICPDGGFIIKRLQYGADEITISGHDLNGMLLDRLSVAQTEDGKDKIAGSTEYIVKHFVDVNCGLAALAARKFPGLVVMTNKNRGIANDAASPRLEIVADVISDILSAQRMGWRINAVNLTSTSAKTLFEFEVYEAVDRTYRSSRPKTFSYGFGNADSIKIENSIADAKNTLYCELSDGTVQTYTPVSDNSGFARAEEYANLGCELSELPVYASHEIAGRYEEVQSVTLDHIDATSFGAATADGFDLGDIVTVVDNDANVTREALITSVKIKRTGENANDVSVGESTHEISITVGEARTKPLDRVSKSVTSVSKSVGSTSEKVKNIKNDIKNEALEYVIKAIGPVSADKLVKDGCEYTFLPVTVQTLDFIGQEIKSVTGLGARLDFFNELSNLYSRLIMSNLYARLEDPDGDNYVVSIGTPTMEFYDYKRDIGFKLYCNTEGEVNRLVIGFGDGYPPVEVYKNGVNLSVTGVQNLFLNGKKVLTE